MTGIPTPTQARSQRDSGFAGREAKLDGRRDAELGKHRLIHPGWVAFDEDVGTLARLRREAASGAVRHGIDTMRLSRQAAARQSRQDAP